MYYTVCINNIIILCYTGSFCNLVIVMGSIIMVMVKQGAVVKFVKKKRWQSRAV